MDMLCALGMDWMKKGEFLKKIQQHLMASNNEW
jgi:hypothetical protein